MDLLRIATAGSVDDGKSTLIGRLLLDSHAIPDDQLAAVRCASRRRGHARTDLALLTDGLRDERAQGITIDVAYRYFATPRRKFILADTPGHVQYTRNMMTGASTADLGLILVDARHGLTQQSRRHAVILSLLRVPHLVLAINKMDLVDYDQAVFQRIRDDFVDFAAKLKVPDLRVIPISALCGDNVVRASTRMAWYAGPPLMYHLTEVHLASGRDLIDARLPVQYVLRPRGAAFGDYRGYAGRVAGGVFRPGEQVLALPSGAVSVVEGIDLADREVAEAFPPMSVTVRLRDDVDVSRGDLLCGPHNTPTLTQDVDAMVAWLATDPLRPHTRLAIKHTTRTVRAVVERIFHRLDIDTLHREPGAGQLATNEIGRVRLRAAQPLIVDPYSRNRTMGSFILIDETTCATVGAGMVNDP